MKDVFWYAYPHFVPATCEVNTYRTGEKYMMVGMNDVLKSTLSSSLNYYLPLRLPYYAFLSIRDKEEDE